ncbi:Carboxypeptidase regulatory-like domain-containing protein [Bacteroides luti]|uniref:Carboxypeptidase regulatory-like domain-containing protein n=1 Tax=Bacteroides luti TaxID=1297750 RepID=A0A1M5BWT1_9BACE|nr:TonB-dependent receptor [Bacteroides luti]SHF47073.1 Carboxypeptidase regulatory-like domain-containing protein [Bacteroides luti]
MKHKLTLLILCLFSTLSLEAQTDRALISGKLLDNTTKTPVEQAAIRVLSLPDSTFVTGVSSKKDGSFSISSLKKGRYVIKVSFIGYATVAKPFQITSTKASANLGEILLKPDAVMLKGTVVTAEAPPVTVVEDTMVYNASAYRTQEGAMLEELVKKLPGAEVSSEGKVTINGKEVKKIMVDGKEFFSDDPKVAMKNLPVNMVENVKAYDKKSDLARITGIDDGDEETVLDLTVKKGMKKGWIGNVITGTGSQNRYEAGLMASQFKDNSQVTVIGSANNTNNQGFSEFGDAGQGMSGNAGSGINATKSIGLNFAKENDKIELGGNVKYGRSDADAKMKSTSETFLGNSSSFGTNNNSSRRFRDDVNGNFRLEWKPDTLTNIIFRPNVSYSKTNSISGGNSTTSNNSHQLVNTRVSTSNNLSDYVSMSGNLQINRKLNNKGRSVTFRAEYGYNNNASDKYSYANTYFNLLDKTDLKDQYIDNTGKGFNYRLQAIYIEPIFDKRFLQFRYSYQNKYSASDKYSYAASENYGPTIGYQDKIYNSDYVDSLSNCLSNRYATNQFELSMRTIRTKYMYNIGISLEPQSSKSKTTVGPNKGKDLSQSVLNFSPTFDMHYRFSKQKQLRFMYRGSSSAPDINNLQAVIDKTDTLNIKYGNPNLKPSYSNRLMLFFNNYMKESQSSVMAHLNFSNTLNSVASKMRYNQNTGGKITDLVNVNGNWSANGFLNYNTPLKNKKFTISTFSNASFSDAVSYTSISANSAAEAQKSTTHNMNLSQRLSGNFRCDLLDFTLNGSIRYSLAKNSLQVNSNRETFDYTVGSSTNINLPWSIYLSSDVNYNIKNGYSGSYKKNQVMWNAQLSKTFLRGNNATLRFKIYDILHQQSNLSRTITETMMQDTEYNTLGSYFMVHFVYRFNTLGKNAPSRRGFDRHGPYDGPRDRPRGGDRPPMGGGGFGGPGGGPGMM